MRVHRPCLQPLLGLALLAAPLAARAVGRAAGRPARRALDAGRLERPRHALHGLELRALLDPAAVQRHPRAPAAPRRLAGRRPRGRGDQRSPTRASPTPTARSTGPRSARRPSGVTSQAFFGVALAPDQGLAGFDMPGAANTPKAMRWDATPGWFSAEGIPITPRDDDGRKNAYPLMKLVARGPGGTLLATTSIVLPVSDEMSCKACHASGSVAAAEPPSGWVNDPDVERDYRRNVLRLHDDSHLGEPAYQQALATGGYLAGGLLATATAGTPILCARCHASNALPGTGQPGLPPLTAAVHSLHATVDRPDQRPDARRRDQPLGLLPLPPRLDHQVPARRDGQGGRRRRRDVDPVPGLPRLDEPGRRADAGRLARAAVLPELPHRHRDPQQRPDPLRRPRSTPTGELRARRSTRPSRPTPTCRRPASTSTASPSATAASPARPATARPTPSTRRSTATTTCRARRCRGTRGVLAECAACHTQTAPPAGLGGPHGLHPIGQSWIDGHQDVAEDQPAACRACHGADSRGTVLSLSQADWTAVDRFRLEALLARLPHRLLRLPRRTRQRGSEPEPPGRGDRPHARDRERRAPPRSRSPRPTPTATRARCASSSSRRTARSASVADVATLYPDPGWNGSRPLHLRGLGRLDRLEPGRGDGRRRVPGLPARRLPLRRRLRVGRHLPLVARAALSGDRSGLGARAPMEP